MVRLRSIIDRGTDCLQAVVEIVGGTLETTVLVSVFVLMEIGAIFFPGLIVFAISWYFFGLAIAINAAFIVWVVTVVGLGRRLIAFLETRAAKLRRKGNLDMPSTSSSHVPGHNTQATVEPRYRARETLFFSLAIVFSFAILASFLGDDIDARLVTLSLLCFGLILGYGIGLLLSPYTVGEEKEFGLILKAISAFIGGYVLSKMEPVIVATIQDEAFWSPVNVFRVFATVGCFLSSFVVVYVHRKYVFEIDILQQEGCLDDGDGSRRRAPADVEEDALDDSRGEKTGCENEPGSEPNPIRSNAKLEKKTAKKPASNPKKRGAKKQRIEKS